jgi:PAS domain S-box-containing protein
LDNIDKDVFLNEYISNYQRALSGESLRVVEKYKFINMVIESKYSPLYSENGEIVGATSYATDIGARQQAEEELRLKSMLLDTAGDSIEVLDLDGTIVYVNDSVCRESGYSREELIGQNITIFDTSEGKKESKRILSEVAQKGFRRFQTQIIRKDGFLIPIDVHCVLEPNGKKPIISVVRDISEQKKIERSIQLNEERLSRILENSSELICEVDGQGKYTYVSKSYKPILGFEASDLIGTYPKDYIHPDDYKKAISRHETIRNNREQSIDEWRFRDSEGKYRLFECHGSVFSNIDGSPMTVVVSHDITERREKELEIKELLKEKDTLIREVHHRVKNSLGIIRSLISLEQMELDDPTAKAFFDKTLNRINAMISLYEQLTLSSSSNAISIRYYIDSLIGKIADSSPSFDSIKIEKDIEDFEVSATHGQALGIIVNEIFTNIMKYAFRDETIKTISIQAKRKNCHIQLIVQDNGKGLPESIDFENSTGLGFMIIRELTKQLDGKIRIERCNGTKIILEYNEGE